MEAEQHEQQRQQQCRNRDRGETGVCDRKRPQQRHPRHDRRDPELIAPDAVGDREDAREDLRNAEAQHKIRDVAVGDVVEPADQRDLQGIGERHADPDDKQGRKRRMQAPRHRRAPGKQRGQQKELTVRRIGHPDAAVDDGHADGDQREDDAEHQPSRHRRQQQDRGRVRHVEAWDDIHAYCGRAMRRIISPGHRPAALPGPTRCRISAWLCSPWILRPAAP